MMYFKNIFKKILVVASVYVLKKHKPFIIVLIGSVGKTMTRNALYAALSKKHSVRKSEQSLTTEIGIPLTLLGCPYPINTIEGIVRNTVVALEQLCITKSYPSYVILEIDGQKKGEVARVAQWLPVDILVVTPVGEIPSHVECFDTPASLQKEYLSIQNALTPDAKVVWCADDEYSREIGGVSHHTVSYGTVDRADICVDTYTILYEQSLPVGISFSFKKPAHATPMVIKDTLGFPVIHAVLASMAAIQALGEHPFSLHTTFEKVELIPGHMKIIPGLKHSVIIDDSYNSSPVAVEELISVLEKIEGKRKICVLGDMLELGRFSGEAHREIGRQCSGFDMLVCVGLRARFIKEGALEAGLAPDAVFHFDTPEKAGEHIQNILKSGDVVAVKGSQGMRMERCVEEIMAEPDKKEKLLVRQSEEWLGR